MSSKNVMAKWNKHVKNIHKIERKRKLDVFVKNVINTYSVNKFRREVTVHEFWDLEDKPSKTTNVVSVKDAQNGNIFDVYESQIIYCPIGNDKMKTYVKALEY